MISVFEATELVLGTVRPYGEECVAIEDAVGRVLAEAIVASRDMPPFDRVAMDGIAIDYAAYAAGQRQFEIEKRIAAGDPIGTLSDTHKAVEIMTGAALPKGADTVIPYEALTIEDNVAHIVADRVVQGQNVHAQGVDLQKGATLLTPGHWIQPADLALLATEGKAKVRVRRAPSFAILSTGDELVPIDQEPLPHQIRRSNVYAVQALLRQYHVQSIMLHLADDPEAMHDQLRTLMGKVDAWICIGGVSKGKKDFLPQVLEALGVRKLFHRVAQRPGKPFWFGATDEIVVFALPVNPVSSIVGTVRYVLPWVRSCLGLPWDYSISVQLAEPFRFDPPLVRFVESELHHDSCGVCCATPRPGHGSGDFTRLAYTKGFVELPADRTHFQPGEVYPFWPFHTFVV